MFLNCETIQLIQHYDWYCIGTTWIKWHIVLYPSSVRIIHYCCLYNFLYLPILIYQSASLSFTFCPFHFFVRKFWLFCGFYSSIDFLFCALLFSFSFFSFLFPSLLSPSFQHLFEFFYWCRMYLLLFRLVFSVVVSFFDLIDRFFIEQLVSLSAKG